MDISYRYQRIIYLNCYRIMIIFKILIAAKIFSFMLKLRFWCVILIMSQKEIQELYSQYQDIVHNIRSMYAMELLNKLCVSTMNPHSLAPTDNQMKEALGEESANFICKLLDLNNRTYPKMTFDKELRKAIQDGEVVDGLADQLKEYNTQLRKVVDITNTQIIYLEQLIDERKELVQQKTDANSEEVKAINDLVAELHDLANADTDHAYELFNDGEIQTTKGGELYGQRSSFQSEKPMLLAPVFEFPLKRGKYSYAVLKYEDCCAIRDRMAKFTV